MTFLQKIFSKIGLFFTGLKAETRRLVPIAVTVVNTIKGIIDSPVDDILAQIIKAAIPGDADDVLIDKVHAVVKEWVPKILMELNSINTIAGIEDQNEQLKAILAEFKLSTNETKNIFYHGLCSLIIEKLSDGKLTWSESIIISEYYVKNFK